ncbi:MAG: sodium:proton antiporter NhaD [Pseudomonadota bacterium]
MTELLTAVFILTYLAISLEHPIKINKSASALLGAGILWSIYAIGATDSLLINEELAETLVSTAQIAFFLIGAMTIVEVVDAHNGFDVVTSKITSRNLSGLMYTICVVTFFLSAILDNLTTTIVMISLLKKLLQKDQNRMLFAGMIVIAANAGGAWSPIGDVTTTMLWIGGQITPMGIISTLILPSIVNLAIPMFIASWSLRGQLAIPPGPDREGEKFSTSPLERNIMFFLGLGVLVSVPAFKAITHLPPFLGVLFGLGILWLVGDILHKDKSFEARSRVDLSHALSRIDLSSIVFFIGILLAVATLEHSGILGNVATWLDETVGRQDVIVMLIGLLSAVVDNVPLVAASMSMYSLEQYPVDSFLWEFLAYCAGTGGSILIIGSAAGVAAMGLEKMDFVWYLRKISGLALVGFFAGAMVYLVERGTTF